MSISHASLKSAKNDLRYLKLLAREFPNVASVTTEIINLEAISHLPKPTEHFMADLHGEHEIFKHVLRNASGNIKRKVKDIFAEELSPEEQRELCTLIYYPRRKLEIVREKSASLSAYYETTLKQLIKVCRSVSSKYTRSKVRKNLPEEYAYIIEELLHEGNDAGDKQAYLNIIVRTIIGTRRAESFIEELCLLIQRLSIDRLHILGDIFDRGPGAHQILDMLSDYHQWDIQWGNHDVLWMGAAAGNPCCMACVLRLSLRYANTQTLEEGYGINMVPLATFAMETYGEDSCDLFVPQLLDAEKAIDEKTLRLIARMHKAITIIQFKLEGQMYKAHPEWKMTDRSLLEHVDLQHGYITLNDKQYDLRDTFLPTVNANAPYDLTAEEADLMSKLARSFSVSERLKRHVGSLLSHGGMYAICNSNLLFHASVPLNEDGTLREVEVCGVTVKGKELLTRVEQIIRTAFDDSAEPAERKNAKDYFWYLWSGPDSPLYGKLKMATFERYLIADNETHVEGKGWYYLLRNSAEVCDRLMDEFEVFGDNRHIINGHVPVRASRGENPVKADGRLMVIDGGFAKAYHNTTGIAGYTLVYHSRGFELVQHEPFTSTEEAVRNGTDIRSTTQIIEMTGRRIMVKDTDMGKQLRIEIADLENLLRAYRKGLIKEK